ncbi:MAG: formylmethanofuran dehydrogenase subunit A [Methanoregula sp.]|nr:formylmethanofuran dehydrogenase subunit A [Methanoregula sp.]
MSEYIIKNGHVFDPVQGIKGDKKDIHVKDGKIVESVSSSAKVVDASGKTVMAGALDIHSHVAGPKVNAGRWYRPEDKHIDSHKKPGITRIEGGKSIPTTFKTGYEYARMGFTFVMEAAMPPLYARHVHEEIHDTPIIDEAALPVFGNNWFILEYLKNQEIENTAAYVAWVMRQTKGYGIKVVNPGGTEAWAWGLNCLTIHDPVPYFEITPAEIMTGLMAANEYLGLPHSMHVHQNDLGNPGNYKVTLDSLKLAEGVKPNNKFGREQVMHSTHLQFHSYKGTNWGDFESGAKEVMDYVNKQKNITIDTGNVTLDETTTMTADGPFEHHLHGLNHLKWINVDVELETAAGVVPFIYDPDNAVFASQWAIGLELALYAKDPMRCFITTDHPNAGPFTRYPRVYAWLMSAKYRNERLNTFKKADKVIAATNLSGLDREITLYELAQMTRAGPARALGLMKDYGGLKAGMNADIAIYNINPDKFPSDGAAIEKAFANVAYLFKDGKICVEGGKVIDVGHKKTFWVDAKVNENKQVAHDVKEKFLRYYSLNENNYSVPESYAPHQQIISVDATQ